jgi:hypothetical protein
MRVDARKFALGCLWLSGAVIAQAVGAQSLPNAPPALQVPKGQALLLHLNGKGKQIYVCQNSGGAYAWKLKAPDAQLFSDAGKLAGRHFAGPSWESTDGSRVTGKLIKSLPSPESGSIAWLLLTAAAHDGAGVMSSVQTIQRLETKGGVPPATGCEASHENEETSVPYSASYYFYGTPAAPSR